MVRNALIAAGNSADAALVEPVRALMEDDDDVVDDDLDLVAEAMT